MKKIIISGLGIILIVLVFVVYNNTKKTERIDITASSEITNLIITKVEGNTASYNSGAFFRVSLKEKPSADVVISISSTDESEGVPELDQITFTSENWYITQRVIVIGTNENVIDGKQDYKIVLKSTNQKKYNAEVDMKGIFLKLFKPIETKVFFSGFETTLNLDSHYTRYGRLSYSLLDNPEGMAIDEDTGVISWIPTNAIEDKVYDVQVELTDGILYSYTDFEVHVPLSSTIKTEINKGTISIMEEGKSLNGVSIKSQSSENIELVSLSLINVKHVPSIPSSIKMRTDIFSVSPVIEDYVEVRFPQSLLEPGESIFDLKVFHYTTKLKDGPDSWSSSGMYSSLESDSDNPVVVYRLFDLEGLYFIGI